MLRLISIDGDRELLTPAEEFHMIAVEVELKDGSRFSLTWGDDTLRVVGIVLPLQIVPVTSNAIHIRRRADG